MVSGTIVMVTSNANEAQAGSSSTTIIGGGFVSNGQNVKCGVPPTWKGEIRGKKRWVPTYFDKHGKPHAFCDRQTGIVIQRTPGTPGPLSSLCDDGVACTWREARQYCANLTVGDNGQKGWRLMYVQELAALFVGHQLEKLYGGQSVSAGWPSVQRCAVSLLLVGYDECD